jgi:hypothetical protein
MTMTEQQSPSIAPLEDVQRDLGALRNDVFRLTQAVTNYVNASGRKAFRDANERVDAAVASVHSSRSALPWASGLFLV